VGHVHVHVLLTLGPHGAAMCCLSDHHMGAHVSHVRVVHMAVLPARVINTSGAGDCAVGGAAVALLAGLLPDQALAHGLVSGVDLSPAHTG
jgi:sugar/nucleoside kinase (ribokinase family)